MQSTVTLELYEYNELYSKALYHENLEIKNKQLKEELAIAHKHLEEQRLREVGTGNMKIAESTEESEEKFRARYPEGVTVINMDDLKKSILLCNKDINSVKEKQREVLDVWMKKIREKESNENVDEKVRLAGLEISSLLKEMYHPHMSVLITPNGVTMLEDHLFVPNK
ncbi:hypothetical protein CW697_10515 [Macrococcoides caseolyticum]|uniref:hypothetical protein n=1 Tax=Macrococcoides caseolyticum TaxID=69966 RepID=UPI000C331921|nr:hypothetical protein [Macrococcus caseolyticus]PKF28968.1 hypothetical protein CW697_10515 [Macrococcus caseolyticus]STY76147.1 Uncharacterised protein [Macrococcus caseolyticus]